MKSIVLRKTSKVSIWVEGSMKCMAALLPDSSQYCWCAWKHCLPVLRLGFLSGEHSQPRYHGVPCSPCPFSRGQGRPRGSQSQTTLLSKIRYLCIDIILTKIFRSWQCKRFLTCWAFAPAMVLPLGSCMLKPKNRASETFSYPLKEYFLCTQKNII